jgi:tetrahydromethanopterin S-methyltransferase subunit F
VFTSTARGYLQAGEEVLPMNRGIIGTIIGVLVIIILVIVILQLT